MFRIIIKKKNLSSIIILIKEKNNPRNFCPVTTGR